MDDLLQEFLQETSENLALLDLELVKFERSPNDGEALGGIIRLMHTIKGTCGFLGLPRLERMAHAGEDVLDRFRSGSLPVSPRAVTLVLMCLDRIRELVAALEANGQETTGDDEVLISQLHALSPPIPPTAELLAEVAASSRPALYGYESEGWCKGERKGPAQHDRCLPLAGIAPPVAADDIPAPQATTGDPSRATPLPA